MNSIFASSGSCFLPTRRIEGKVVNNTFISNEFTANITDFDFWEKLRKYAQENNCFVELVY